MTVEFELFTPRLKLRRWRPEDREPFAALNADPEVMEYFPGVLTREQSDRLVESIEASFEENGYGLWALEVRATGEFIGFTGLAKPEFEAHFTPVVEVGWRLARSAWGTATRTHNPSDDFDHPGLPEGDPLRRHVLYRAAATT